MHKVLPLFKSHFSLGKSILTLEKPPKIPLSYPISVFDLLKQKNLKTLVLVEDCISGLLQASKVAEEEKVKLIYGLRLDVSEDITQKDEPSLKKRAKYIIFAKNPRAYVAISKIWSIAANKGFYYEPNIDFASLKQLWSDDVMLVVPFYDSFLHLNTLHSHVHVPDFNGLGDVRFLTESNELPFDDIIQSKVEEYCKINNREIIQAQSIYYKSPDDYLAYLTFRCIHNKGHTQKTTLEEPNLEHMTSDKFNFDKWESCANHNNGNSV